MRTVTVTEGIGIRTIRILHEELKSILETEKEISLDFTEVQRVDLSVLQLLKSAGIEAKKEKIKITYKGIGEELRNQFRIYGMIR